MSDEYGTIYNLKTIKSGKRLEIYKISSYVVSTGDKSKYKEGRRGKGKLVKRKKRLILIIEEKKL